MMHHSTCTTLFETLDPPHLVLQMRTQGPEHGWGETRIARVFQIRIDVIIQDYDGST